MENATPTPPPDAPAAAAALPEKRPQVEKLLTDILGMLGSPARLEFKDLSDGTLGVALHFAGEVPGAGPKRNLLVESLQFLLNKAINRPNLPRRWVTLGVQGFPEPRQSRPEGEARHEKPAAAPAPAAQGPKAPAVTQPPRSSPAAPAQAQRNGQRPANEKGTPRQDRNGPRTEQPPRPPRGGGADEATLEVAEDPNLTRLAKSLGERAARLGRTYALTLLSAEDRARVVKALVGLPGVRAKVEGDGHFRRVVFVPEKPVPMPKKAPMPDYDDEEE